MEMAVVLLWIAFSVVVAFAADARGRDAGGWLVLALFISPLVALPLVLVMQSQIALSKLPQLPFVPDAVHAGIPYRLLLDGSVEAVMQGARVQFADYGKFFAATGAPLPPTNDHATQWLDQQLYTGPVEAAEIFSLAEQKGIGRHELMLAKVVLNVVSTTQDGRWMWRLPGASSGTD